MGGNRCKAGYLCFFGGNSHGEVLMVTDQVNTSVRMFCIFLTEYLSYWGKTKGGK